METDPEHRTRLLRKILGVTILALSVWSQSGGAQFDGAQSTAGNHLANEKSPYLLLHSHNPVNWYPWGVEAFQKAVREQKPIFLSIGYYTCHWCHVMERESYSNPDIAAVLNRYFVAIKVDREERPDVDRLYIAYLESANGTAGWPANIMLTPDRQPFAGGIYFPPDKLKKWLEKVAESWSKNRDRTVEVSSRAAQALSREVANHVAPGPLPPGVLDKTYRQIASMYDSGNGGFGVPPKFPRPVALEFLLRTWARTGQAAALDMVKGTLLAMARGGIRDQIGGGFHRYATDARWRVPHFEKMLYDQAQLVAVYTEAYQTTHDDAFAAVARSTLDFTLRELQLPGGGFGSALDADSPLAAGTGESAEGVFYRWTADNVAKVLGPDAAMFNFAYGIETNPSVPWRAQSDDAVGKRFELSPAQAAMKLAGMQAVLCKARDLRPHPPRDDKAVAAWNGMMVSALSRASQALNDPWYLAAAQATMGFIESRLLDPVTGRLQRSWRGGTTSGDGFLDDYTSLIAALIDLYQADFNVHWLERAVALQDKQEELFGDARAGGYFDTAAADTGLLARTRDAYDGAEPTPNSRAAMNLLRLWHITGREDWKEKAGKTLALFGGTMAAHPESLPALASALDFALAPARHILIAGNPDAADTKVLLRLVNGRYLPNAILMLADGGPAQQQIARWLPFVAGAHPIGGRATAYICDEMVCKLPTPEPAVVARLLGARLPDTRLPDTRLLDAGAQK
jgi:uncharacterized protein YyaL (SSP411 family)